MALQGVNRWLGLLLGAAAIVLIGCPPGDGTFEQPMEELTVPTTVRELYEFLEARSYRDFDHESAPHPPAGPHQVTVQAYMNRALVQSLTDGNTQHPRGSVAIKELYDTEGALFGWAVMVKQREGDDGTAWFWYETHRGPGRAENPNYVGDGVGACIECHAEGRGYVRIPFPLR